jgi:hypothetical protein
MCVVNQEGMVSFNMKVESEESEESEEEALCGSRAQKAPQRMGSAASRLTRQTDTKSGAQSRTQRKQLGANCSTNGQTWTKMRLTMHFPSKTSRHMSNPYLRSRPCFAIRQDAYS